MVGWMLGRTVGVSVGLVMSAAVLAGIEGRAEACSPLPDLMFEARISDGALTAVPTDGVIAFRGATYGDVDEALALMSITVTSGDAEVPGTIETIMIDEASDYAEMFVVWRPDGGFAPSSEYVASIAVLDFPDATEPSVQIQLDVSTSDAVLGALPTAALVDPALSALSFEIGERVCCDGDNCGPSCVGVEVEDRATLAAALELGDNPLLSQVYLRAASGPSEDALAQYGVLDVGSQIRGASLQYSFEAPADAYCIGVEVVSLVDGTVVAPVVVCEDHGELVLESGANPGLEPFAEECPAPYWEDTNEPYVPDGGTEGGSTEDDGGDAEGTADGGDADATAEGGDADGGSADESSGGADGGQDDDKSGCACDVSGDASPWSAMLSLLVVGAAVRRRRR